MSPQPLQSPALQRAARRELDRLVADQRRIEQRLELLENERSRLREELRIMSDQAALLREVLGGRVALGTAQAPTGVILRAARLREEAARVLLERAGPDAPVHYAKWHDWVVDEGFVVLGKRPKSTFLTGATRSVLVRRGEEPGTYFVAPSALNELERELNEKRAELVDLDSVLSREAHASPGMRQHRVGLLAGIRRLEGQIAEARRVLAAARSSRTAAIRAA